MSIGTANRDSQGRFTTPERHRLYESARFVDPDAAYRELTEGISIDLEEQQDVCQTCWLVFWGPLGYCPTCRAHAEESGPGARPQRA